MRSHLLKTFDRLVLRAQRQFLNRRRGDSFNILDAAFLKAAMESADYYEAHMRKARLFATNLELLSHGFSLANHDGLCIEFGVATGATIRHLASKWTGEVYGFDSFEGCRKIGSVNLKLAILLATFQPSQKTSS